MRDFLGNEYEVGDFILYAGMCAQSAQMTYGQVVSINEKTVVVQPIEDSRFGRWSARNDKKPRRVTLKVLKNIVKYPDVYKEQFEAARQALLEGSDPIAALVSTASTPPS